MTERRCKTHPEVEPRLIVTPKEFHYGKWVCAECEKHIAWARQPRTSDGLDVRQNQILDKVLEGDLSRTDLAFLMKVYMKPHLGIVETDRLNGILMGSRL